MVNEGTELGKQPTLTTDAFISRSSKMLTESHSARHGSDKSAPWSSIMLVHCTRLRFLDDSVRWSRGGINAVNGLFSCQRAPKCK
jgi:hypothetical protein